MTRPGLQTPRPAPTPLPGGLCGPVLSPLWPRAPPTSPSAAPPRPPAGAEASGTRTHPGHYSGPAEPAEQVCCGWRPQSEPGAAPRASGSPEEKVEPPPGKTRAAERRSPWQRAEHPAPGPRGSSAAFPPAASRRVFLREKDFFPRNLGASTRWCLLGGSVAVPQFLRRCPRVPIPPAPPSKPGPPVSPSLPWLRSWLPAPSHLIIPRSCTDTDYSKT